jgi:YD repeat-containing protein
VPCRYERTPVRLSVGQATGYTGTETAEAATTALATSGVVAQVIYEGGRAVGVDAVLTWVRAFVPYGSYRGATGSTGTAKWVSLVPALKRYRSQDIDAVDLRDAVAFDFSDYLSEERADSPVEVLSRDLLATARARNLPCTNVADMTKRRTIVREELALLPDEPAAPRSPTLPGFTEITSDLDAGRRHGIGLRVKGSSGGTVILYETSMPAVYGHTVALRYEPATAEDEATLASHGGIDGTAPWLYRLRPVLYVDDQSVGEGPADQPGREAAVEVVLTHPSRYREARSAVHPVVVGGVYAFIFDAGGDLRAAREASRARLAALPEGTDARMAEKLQGWGLEWFAERHHAYEAIAGVTWNRLLLDVNEAMAALRPRVTTVAGAVVSLTRDRDVFDAGRLLVTPYAIDGDQSRSAFVTKLAGHTGSFLEHRVAQGEWTRNQWSAVRVVQRARQDGAVVLTIEPINEAQLDLVDASADLIEDMRARLRAGYTVTVPEHPVVDATLGDLHAYMAVREETGEGAFVIEGVIDGGYGESGQEDSSDSEDGDCESCPACCEQSASSVNLAKGNYTFSEADLMLPARGIPIVLTRTYSALDARARSLGPGWSHSYERRLDEDVATGNVLWTDSFGRARTFRALGSGAYEPPAGFFSTLARDAGGFTVTTPDGMVERFAATGELQYDEDPNGNRVTLGYGAGGRLETVTDAAGRLVLSFTYTAAGRLETVADLAGREVRYAYSAGDDLAVVTDVLGNDWTFATDGNHRLVGKTDPDGGTVTIGYDDRGRAQTVVDRLGNAWQASYDFANRRAVWTDRRGSSTVFEYDANGAPVRVTDPLGNVTETEWDGRLNRLSDTDARGNRTTRTYDDQGNVLSTTDPLGRTTSFEYGALSRLTSATDALDQTSTNEYDPAGNLVTSTDALGNVTTYEVDLFGQPSAIVRSGGARTEIVIDDSGNVTSITDPEGGTTRLGYDAAGHMTSLTDANDHTRTMEVDDAGRLHALTDPLNHRTSFEYDARGNRISATDAAGQTTLFRYDAQSRIVETEDALGHVRRNSRKPISNPVRSSEIRNAGTRRCRETSDGSRGREAALISYRSARSSSRVWRSRNSEIAAFARAYASASSMRCSVYGSSASSLIRCATGAMTTPVRSRDRASTTCVGGTFWVPIACRTNDRTTTIRVNDVIETRIAGAIESTVRRSRIFRAGTTCSGPSGLGSAMVTWAGAGCARAIAGTARVATTSAAGRSLFTCLPAGGGAAAPRPNPCVPALRRGGASLERAPEAPPRRLARARRPRAGVTAAAAAEPRLRSRRRPRPKGRGRSTAWRRAPPSPSGRAGSPETAPLGS